MSTVYVFFAEGFEEIEGLTVVDLLRRAEVEVKMIGVTSETEVTGSHGISVKMDAALADVSLETATALVLPGGMPGTKNLGKSEQVNTFLKEADQKGILIGAICAAPSVLGDLGLLKGKRAVCYPGFEDRLKGAEIVCDEVVEDGNIITSRGMGTAISFGLALIAGLKDETKANEIADAIIYQKGE